jgi:peptide/nickel transport system substrate-binding protein/oligopeptide transport system substrate-binding protein
MLEKIVGAKDFESGKAKEVTGIKVIDPQTLEITLSEPLAPFKSMLASANLSVVPQEEVEKYGADFGQHVVAAGPFKLGTWNINQDVTLDAFQDYYGGRPYLDAVKFRFIGDENTRIVEFNAKNLDIAWVTPAAWDTFNADPVLKNHLGWAHTFHTEFWAINMEKQPFGNNPKLRQAIRYALDMDSVIQSLQGRATVAQGILPPGLLGYDKNATLDYPMDLDKAKQLMKDAGYANGVPGTFDVMMPNWANEVTLCEIYQANLKEIGINVNLKPSEWGAYSDAISSGNFDIAWVYRVTDYADPDGFYFPLLDSQNIGAGGNWARYKNAAVDAAIEKARATLDDATRVQLYKTVDDQYVQDLPYIPLFHNIWVDVSQPYVMNYVPSPMDTHMYQKVWLNK